MYGDADAKALRKLTIFAVIILVSLVVSFIISFLYNPFSRLLAIRNSSSGSLSNISFGPNFLEYVAIGSLVTIVVEIFTLLQLRSAFKTLSTVDRPRFKTPAFLTLLLVIAVPIVLAGTIIEIAGLLPYMNTIFQQQQAGQTITPPPISSLGQTLAGAALAFIGGIITLIGVIGGLILGIWRMGARYAETLFKVAAILFIIPLLDVLSPILILIGVSQARKKLPATP